MSNNKYTQLVNGKRQWTPKSLEILRDAGNLENLFIRFNKLNALLDCAFKECGDTFKKKEDSETLCKWTIHTQGWLCNVILSREIQYQTIVLRVGHGIPPPRPVQDLFPLWEIIRENWKSEHRN